MSILLRWYSRRIVNINVNILVASTLAAFATGGVMHALVLMGLPEQKKILVGSITFFVDLVVDLFIYYVLHWVANHMPRATERLINPEYARKAFLKDASYVQFQRMLLSPILYIIALGGQNVLLNMGYSVFSSTVGAFGAGVLTTRVLHTLWMLRADHVAKKRGGAGAAGAGRP
ncbi:MAG: hypothetical protein GC200_10115 [Tepidisphaera sp.]|nr:hypothetical protein [Tepidisphaera sp.]